jgi:hypothetical protein
MKTRATAARSVGPVIAACLLALGPGLVRAQSQVDVLLHGAGLNNAASASRDGGYAAGLYATWAANWKHLLEVNGTFMRIRYTAEPDLEQFDLAAAYSRFWSRGSVRIGGHWVESTDALTDGGLVVFGGASVYRPGVWSVGTEAAASRYDGWDGGLTVVQLAPAAGVSWGNARRGYFGAVVRGYWIHHSLDVGVGARDFVSGEAALFLTFRAVTLSGTGWFGEQSFAVRNGGMFVYNLADLHEGGYGGGARWVVNPRTAVSGGLYVERLRAGEPGRNENTTALMFALGFTL